MSPRRWITIGAILGGLGVVLGAFGAHGIPKILVAKYANAEPRQLAGMEIPTSYKYLQDFNTAAEYQMYHALALIGVGLLGRAESRRSLQFAGWSFLTGVVLFSGSLYVLALSGLRWMGAITPFGGLAFIAGWISMAVAACRFSTTNGSPASETVGTKLPNPTDRTNRLN